jgi:hypothetical protein
MKNHKDSHNSRKITVRETIITTIITIREDSTKERIILQLQNNQMVQRKIPVSVL